MPAGLLQIFVAHFLLFLLAVEAKKHKKSRKAIATGLHGVTLTAQDSYTFYGMTMPTVFSSFMDAQKAQVVTSALNDRAYVSTLVKAAGSAFVRGHTIVPVHFAQQLAMLNGNPAAATALSQLNAGMASVTSIMGLLPRIDPKMTKIPGALQSAFDRLESITMPTITHAPWDPAATAPINAPPFITVNANSVAAGKGCKCVCRKRTVVTGTPIKTAKS